MVVLIDAEYRCLWEAPPSREGRTGGNQCHLIYDYQHLFSNKKVLVSNSYISFVTVLPMVERLS